MNSEFETLMGQGMESIGVSLSEKHWSSFTGIMRC